MPGFIDAHDTEIEELANTFVFRNITKGKIRTWLRQFAEAHQPVALKLLHNLRFYDSAKIHTSCKILFKMVKSECENDLDNVIFMGLGPAGKSGDMMLHRFRHANGMHTDKFKHMFKHTTEITSIDSAFNGSLVFLDDFIGSGSQAMASLFDIASIAPPGVRLFLLVVAGYASAIEELGSEKEFDCNVLAVDVLDESEKLFSDANDKFTEDEKAILRSYCENTGSRYPYGYRDVGSLVIFCDSVPNNTPSILIHESDNWRPLFPRI